MAEHWQSLVADLAVVALFISAWVHGQFMIAKWPRRARHATFGVVMGLGAMASMLLAIPIGPVYFDLRSSLMALAGFFGGPPAALVAVTIAIAYRTFLGGPAMVTADLGIAIMALVGIGAAWATRNRLSDLARCLALTGAVGILSIALGIILQGGFATMTPLSIAVALTNTLATAVSSFFITRQRATDRERDLLRAAFVQSHDVRYVKTLDGRYVAANEAMATALGLRSRGEIIGRTDHDILDARMAANYTADDRQVLGTGEGYTEREEMYHGPDGEEVWYASSKEPLYNRDGDLIGVGGVTRDISVRKRLEKEVVESRNQLNYVLSEVSDGIAMFDRQGTLVYCNEQYRQYFALTAAIRRPGQNIRDILRAVVETGEQNGVPAGGEAHWIDEIAATLTAPGSQEVQLHDGRWLHIRTRPTADGAALVVVSEFTKIKQAEAALLDVTARLKVLAATDGLTGLTNRRAFDIALETEMSRSTRTNQPLALLMIDVDHFKNYNDRYGHQAGDEVLKAIAHCLKLVIKRPSDIAARYGGEEFAAILPDTDEDGACIIADAFRDSLHALDIPHGGSLRKVVTASVGISVWTEHDRDVDTTELIRRADEALYKAKDAGRDRIIAWHPKQAIKIVRALG